MSKIDLNDNESLKKISKQTKSVTDNIALNSVSTKAMDFIVGNAKPLVITLVYLAGSGIAANVIWIVKLVSKIF